MKDLEDLKLTEPLQLKTVKTKNNGAYLSAIQCVFKNGVESPIIDGGANCNDPQEHEVTGSKITKILQRHDGDDTCAISFVHENGTQEVFRAANPNDYTLDVPAGHTIVGVYGRKNSQKTKYLGWILAKF